MTKEDNSDIFIHGIGAVSPAGWGVPSMREVLAKGQTLPLNNLARPGRTASLPVRQVPMPVTRPDFLAHPRLRRTSPITQYAVAAALEALGEAAASVRVGTLKLGVVVCTMTGCVNYSRRFFDETLRDPATASPLVFPETVFNAPASHLAALLGTTAASYTLVGDPGTFLQGLALAADWLLTGRVNGCLVIGAEELDWLTAEAYRLFAKDIVLSAGAGAVFLARTPSTLGVQLRQVTDAHVFTDKHSQRDAARRTRAEFPAGEPDHVLCDSTQGIPRVDDAGCAAWADWTGNRLSPKTILGEGLAAAAAWQCVAAIDALHQTRFRAATVSVVGCNEQTIGAQFERTG